MMYCCELCVNGRSKAFPGVPGTHQSGAVRRAGLWEARSLYSDCQEKTVYTQLLYGIRFLDLGPAAVKSGEF